MTKPAKSLLCSKQPFASQPRRGRFALHSQGECAELYFAWRAAQRGLGVLRPWGHAWRYDVVLDTGERLIRVQVKSVTCFRNRAFQVIALANNRRYTAAEIDFIAALVVPMNAWYIVPIAEVDDRASMQFSPHIQNSTAKYEKFREAWHLLK